MPPTFYFAIGARPRPRDLVVAMLTGQRHFLVPAGSAGARLLQRTPGIHVVLDSWAYPPGNPVRPTLARYAHLIASWYHVAGHTEAAHLDWAVSYDTIGNPRASARDDLDLQRLCAQLCRTPDPPVVPVAHYPDADAMTMIGTLLQDRDLSFDEPERAQAERRTAWDFVDEPDGPTDWPAYAIGGLVPARYSRDAAHWFARLRTDLDAATQIDPLQRRVHLLGVGKPSWVLTSPLVMSFDSSGPVHMAQKGFAGGIGARYTDAFGLSVARLRCSREARLAYHLCDYQARLGLPWQRVNEDALLDDRELPPPPVPDESWEQPALVALAG